ncbi:MAG: GrpB family protein [Paracoccaceae bacterium]
MTEPLGLRQGTLRLVPWSATWPDLFAAEQACITAALAPLTVPIAHIGSTAVPDLVAKPIIDIAMIAPEADHPHIAATLTSLGYTDRGLRSGRLFIRLQDGDIRTHNLHLYIPGDPEWHDHLAFRDALRADPGLRAAYAALKQQIAEDLQGKRLGYAEAKTDFIRHALRR